MNRSRMIHRRCELVIHARGVSMPHGIPPAVALYATSRLFGGCAGRYAYTPPPMQPSHRRAELDQIAGHYSLDSAGVDALLEACRGTARSRRQPPVSRAHDAHRRHSVARRRRGVLRRRELEQVRGLRPLCAARTGARGLRGGCAAEATSRQRRPRRTLPRVHHHRRVAGAVRSDLPDRRRRLRACSSPGLC